MMTKDYSQCITHLVYSPKSDLFELSLSNDTHFVGDKAKSLIEWLWLDKGAPQAFRPIEIARATRSDRKSRLSTIHTDAELKQKLKNVMERVANNHYVDIDGFKFNSFMGCHSLYAYVDVDPPVMVDLNFALTEEISLDENQDLCNFKYVGIFDYKKDKE